MWRLVFISFEMEFLEPSVIVRQWLQPDLATPVIDSVRIVAELAIDGARFRVADEAPEASNLSPQALNGTTVRINLLVADPDRLAERAIVNGAVEIAPIADQSYGLRQGRLADPFGHHWLIGRPLAGETGDWARTPDR
jgi:PhnB protein